MADVIRGTEIKFNLSIAATGGIKMSTYDFKAIAYCNGTRQKVEIPKSDCTYVDNDNYVLPVDTSSLGLGPLIIDVYAYIPDQDFFDDLRTDIARVETDINIIQ